MNPTWKAYLIGLANAALSGAAVTASGFGLGVPWKTVMLMTGFAAYSSLAKWMAQHPLPGALNGNGHAPDPTQPKP